MSNQIENQTKADVTEYLWNIEMTNEIHELWDILKVRHKQLQEKMATQFNVGDGYFEYHRF